MRCCKYRKCKCYSPPPPKSDDTSEIEQEYGKNSFGVYAKVGVGYSTQVYCDPTTYTCHTKYYYHFVPGVSAYYAWRASNGMGVEVALEYEYNASNGIGDYIKIDDTLYILNTPYSMKASRNFFTPALYFSQVSGGAVWRVGLGYDMSLPSTLGSLTASYQGVAIMSSSEWILNKNNAIGIFVKGSFRWLNLTAGRESTSEFDHIMLTLGLSYRFNMGF